jgi:hypothetical protein
MGAVETDDGFLYIWKLRDVGGAGATLVSRTFEF